MLMRRAFDPARVAHYENDGWRAYYDRDWQRVLRLMVRLNREQFAMPWPVAGAAAFDMVRAAPAFAPVDHDLAKVLPPLRSFYAKARASAGIAADAPTLADLELRYWVVHRELAERRKRDRADANLEPLVQAFAELHAALFASTPERMRVSAELRALATVAVDRITGGYSDDIAADWRRSEALLHQAYQAVLLVEHRAAAPTIGGV